MSEIVNSEFQSSLPPIVEISSLPFEADKFYDLIWNQHLRGGQRLCRIPLAVDTENRLYLLLNPSKIQQHSEIIRLLGKKSEDFNFAVLSLSQETANPHQLKFPDGKSIPLRLGSDTYDRPATIEQLQKAFNHISNLTVE